MVNREVKRKSLQKQTAKKNSTYGSSPSETSTTITASTTNAPPATRSFEVSKLEQFNRQDWVGVIG